MNGEARHLTREEVELLTRLLEPLPQSAELISTLADSRVQVMKDGGMGSLRFVSTHADRRVSEVVTAKSSDEDGTDLEIAINIDQHGRLFELDIWKVDFSPLLRFPQASQVCLV